MDRLAVLREKFTPFADAILLTNELHQYYISGFRFTDGYVLVTAKEAFLLTDFRYTEAAGAAVSSDFTVLSPKEGVHTALGDLAAGRGIRTLAFEDDSLPCAALEALRGQIKAEFVPARGILREMRRRKGHREIEKIRIAQQITDDAFAHILRMITPKMSETDVAIELEFYMRRHGAEDKSFDTIAVSGKASSLPHGVPRRIPLQKGFLTMDFGCVVDGYHSDMTRTVCLGKADGEMRRLYDTVLSAQTAVLQSVQVGMKCSAVDAIARDVIENAGYHGAFGHSLGHSVGLEIHEDPGFRPKSADFFEVGNVITVEPGIYLAGKYGCRIEDMIYAESEDKIVNLTHSGKDLIELF